MVFDGASLFCFKCEPLPGRKGLPLVFVPFQHGVSTLRLWSGIPGLNPGLALTSSTPCENHSVFLSLSFLICKMRMVGVPQRAAGNII